MTLLAKLRAYEPIRLYVYPLLVVLVAFLLARGIIDGATAELIRGLLEALAVGVLGISAAEAARAQVTPEAKVIELGTAVAADAIDAVKHGRPVDVQAILKAAREAGTYFGNRGDHRAG
ncbi:hypothetical protein CH298_02580 [Rhodococcoides fascians]|uniref:hypothetical protein n=1 Tax=Rhodococcoides fascians TaxID=1828 RepID=UPI000B9BCA34|nr:hypothetical protein [Rhodococcus fascians]OZE92438.1 hypothetical protein CH303_02580 [Rhodococcus fascians]OZF23071.1 hypothetical protein CH298_02580 [Rhodococcus fascians]OZF24785.1 hypothetical protein CH297_02580 [Rhodococcus fascians]OZF72380.1 hypothetical protein CH308_02585 [Rhodococcus fascians]OZF73678.1 hypothetical protein CH307_02580 [Rhodococcus fascians]